MLGDSETSHCGKCWSLQYSSWRPDDNDVLFSLLTLPAGPEVPTSPSPEPAGQLHPAVELDEEKGN